MLVAILEKLIYVTAMVSLYVKGYLHVSQVAVAIPDFTLAMLFVAAFVMTPEADSISLSYSPPVSRTPAYARWGSWPA